MDLIHITAAYSNAVLVAVLPHISEFAAKLDLPVQLPITTNQVRRSNPSPYKGFIADGILLTNRYTFGFHWQGYDGARGCVESFRAPTNFFFEQEFQDLSKYVGEDHMTTKEAIAMARDTLSKLGYKPELTHSCTKRRSWKVPFDIRTAHVPYCSVTWTWATTEYMTDRNEVRIEINMDLKKVVGISLLFSPTNQVPTTPIKVEVVPELESDYQKRMKESGKMFINTNAPPRYPQKPADKH